MDLRDEISLNISEEVEHLMNDRLIRRDMVQQVVRHAETTGVKFVNRTSGRSLAFLRPGRVTYWVEYSGDGLEFRIHGVYSHRMELKRGPGS